MKLITNTKILRKILILCLLTVGLVFVASKDATPVSAKDCGEAFDAFSDAMNTFDTAFQSYYYNSPTSCATDCMGSGNPALCEENCIITRRTDLGNADTGMFQAGADVNVCTHPEPNYCAIARGKNNTCRARYNPRQYSDIEQRLEISNAYMECRNASGIDRCE